MKIRHFITKDIAFKKAERHKATKAIKRLIKSGWLMQEGCFIDDLIFGDISATDPDTEEVQLFYCF